MMNDSRKLTVVHVITGLNQGGAEAMLLRLLTFPRSLCHVQGSSLGC